MRWRWPILVVVIGLVAGVGFGLRQDPIRYGVAVPPLVNGADYGEAYLVGQVRDSVQGTAGPYIGPNPDLSDAVDALNVQGQGPSGQRTFSAVVSSRVSPGHDFTGRAQALVRLCFQSAGWFLGSESGPRLERCRLVTIRYQGSGRIRFSSQRAPCPQAAVPPGAGCAR